MNDETGADPVDSVAEELAKKHGVRVRTIHNAAAFSEAVDEIESNVTGARRDILSGKTGMTQTRVREVAALPPE